MDSEIPFRVGDVLGGKYRLERLLGTGGMGVVFAASHLELERRVALKLMRPESCDNEASVARFLLEARATARLNGPHVAKVLDVDRLDSGVPFLVIEFLEGQNLHALLAARGPLPATQAIDFLLEVCEAVAEAHSKGIVHRDLKPANLFLTCDAYGDPCVKVLDFGISKLLEPRSVFEVGLTESRAMMGSPVYMSPEQMRSARDVDHRTDIWGLGTVLFELLTGRPPWSGQTLSDLCAQVTRDPCPNITELCGSVPPELSAIVERCLQKAPEQRFQHVTDLALALTGFASPRGKNTVTRVLQLAGHSTQSAIDTTQAPRRDATVAPHSPSTTLPATSSTRATGLSRRRLFPPVAATTTLLLVLGIVSWIRSSRPTLPHVARSEAESATSVANRAEPTNLSKMPASIASTALLPAQIPQKPSPSGTMRAARLQERAPVAAGRLSSTRPQVTAPTTSIDPMSIRKNTPAPAIDPMSIRK